MTFKVVFPTATFLMAISWTAVQLTAVINHQPSTITTADGNVNSHIT